MAGCLRSICWARDDDDDSGDENEYDGPPQIEVRCYPRYDEYGGYIHADDRGDGSTHTIYLCRYLVPYCIARVLTRMGLDCGVRFSTGGLPGWVMGTRSGRQFALFFLLVALVLFFGWTSYQHGRQTGAILASPCYVCNPQPSYEREEKPWWEASEAGNEAARAMQSYAVYAHGPGCSLDDGWVRALEQEYGSGNASHHNATTTEPWKRYDRWLKGAPLVPPPPLAGNAESKDVPTPAVDWRNTLPRAYLVGFRGAGTTSLRQYLGAHPEVAMRHDSVGSVTASKPRGAHSNTQGILGDAGTPWDNHFFASVPDWTPDEIRRWVRRGWGAASLRDHRGQGKMRIETGADYLWLASTGAAESIRRARLPDGSYPKFVVLLADPVRLVREAHQRAVDAGVESRTSLSQVVAEELPRLAQCLWWDAADSAEQSERLLSGLCGAPNPGRLGPPYLWRGFVSVYVSHWMRAATPGSRQQWYFIRSEDLLRQPNRTLNRLAVHFLGLQPFDFGSETRRLWHPDPVSVSNLAPGAPWRQSWKSYVPRLEFLKQARKRTTDALLDAASRAARRVVPGLDAALKTREKLKQLHCRLAGLFDKDAPLTHQGHDCVQEHEPQKTIPQSDAEKEAARIQREAEREAEAEAALYDFFAPYQQQLMDIVEATHYTHRWRNSECKESENQHQDGGDDDADLRKFYLN